MQDQIERLKGQGHIGLTTVGEIMDGPKQAIAPASFTPAALEGSPPIPPAGIYFDMPDEAYHAIPALSNSGVKKLAASPMLFWASTPWLNPRKRDEEAEEKAHHVFGKAYHCRIMEGRAAFDSRFAVGLDKADYPDCLESTDEIKAAINGAGEKPSSKVPDKMPDGSEYMRAAKKDDWICQLLDLDPAAQVFARLAADHRSANEGKTFLTAEQFAQLEIAAAMVEKDPEVQHAFKGGYAEVTLIWNCAVTGVPMKARVDYLKIKVLVDLKTVGNQRERSIEQAIRFEIATYHYNIQPAVYEEGAKVVRQLIRDGKAAIEGDHDQKAWALKWASHVGKDEWLWVFQQKGDAPITRGVFYPLAGTTHMISGEIVASAKRRLVTYSKAFGTDPWLDTAPIYTIADEDIPRGSTEI